MTRVCGRYGLFNDPSGLVRRLRAREVAGADFTPRYNIAPTMPVLAIVNTPEREVRSMRWGLVPRYPDCSKTPRSTFNARIETLSTSTLFGPALRTRRCIVVADGYYEWPRDAAGAPSPVWIFRGDGATIAFAGLWDGEAVTIITRPPTAATEHLHDRMPTTLEQSEADAWLTSESLEPRAALALLPPCPADVLSFYHVARTVGNVRVDAPELIAPAAPAVPTAQLALFG